MDPRDGYRDVSALAVPEEEEEKERSLIIDLKRHARRELEEIYL